MLAIFDVMAHQTGQQKFKSIIGEHLKI